MRHARPADPYARIRAILTHAYGAAALAYSQKKFKDGVSVRGVKCHPPFSSWRHSSTPDRSVTQFGRNLRDPEQGPLACAKARIKEHRSDWRDRRNHHYEHPEHAYASFNSFFLDEVRDRDAVIFKALLTDLDITFYEGDDPQSVVTLYRGDERSVVTILKEGFRPKPGFGYAEVRYKDEFLDYMSGSYGVSTSKDEGCARSYPQGDHHCRLSEIRFPPGAVKHFVAVALFAMHYDTLRRYEVNFLQRIPPCLIYSVTYKGSTTINDHYLGARFIYQPKVKVPALEIEVEPQAVAPALHPLQVMLTTGARVVVAKGNSAMAMAHLIFLTQPAAQALIQKYDLKSDDPQKQGRSKGVDSRQYTDLFLVRMSVASYSMLVSTENNLRRYAQLESIDDPKTLSQQFKS